MSTTTYQVKKKVTGGYAVSYACPHCAVALTSKLEESGTSQACPTCNKPFVVPGKAEREQLRAKLEQEKREKEKAAQLAAENKRIAQDYAAKQDAIAKQDEAVRAREVYVNEQRQLLVNRRHTALKDRNNRKQGIGLQIVLLILAIDAALSLFFAFVAAMTVIGLPIAGLCLVNFAVTAAACYVIDMLNELNRGIHEAVDHLRFQSSLLAEKMDSERRS